MRYMSVRWGKAPSRLPITVEIHPLVVFTLLLAVFALVLATISHAQVSLPPGGPTTGVLAVSRVPVSDVQGLVTSIWSFLKTLQDGDLLAALIALTQLLMSLLKLEPVQKLVARLIRQSEDWRWGPRQKNVLVLVLGVTASYFLAPGVLWYRVVTRGIVIALASIGLYEVYKNFVKQG